MANQSNRQGGRDRYGRNRGYGRQAEQFDTTSQQWHNEEHGYGQFGEPWRDDDRFDTFTGNDFGGRDFSQPRRSGQRGMRLGAGSQLASGHGEWHDRPDRSWGESNERGWFDRASDEVASWFGDEDATRRREIYDHRGRGPEGYTRSDDRILEDACDELTEDWGVDASKIQISVSGGEVTLTGTVPSRLQKHRAEDCVEDLSGVRHVQNNLRVEDRRSGQSGG